MFKKIFKIDFALFLPIIVLLSLGLLILSSLSFASFWKQISFIIMSFIAFIIFSNIDYQLFRNYSFVSVITYLFGISSLFILLVMGKITRGITGWFDFGFFSIQPVEFMKFALILILAKYLATRNMHIAHLSHILISSVYVVIPCVLALLQPDLGSVLIFFAIWLVLLLVSGLQPKHLLLILFCLFLAGGIGWKFVLRDYQKERITAFLNPLNDPRGSNYNLRQSIIAVGSGKFFGKGIGWGTQTQLQFLPESKTDFVFASLGEETGFIGITILFGAFVLLFKRLYEYVLNSNNNFSKLFIIGFIIKLSVETIINIGVNIGVLPVVGIALPFLTLGGSHLVADFIMLGIISNMHFYHKYI